MKRNEKLIIKALEKGANTSVGIYDIIQETNTKLYPTLTSIGTICNCSIYIKVKKYQDNNSPTIWELKNR